jgi:hypothetical protein
VQTTFGADEVIRLQDQHVVAHLSGVNTSAAFVGPSALAVSLSADQCRFGRLETVDLETRTIQQVNVWGVSSGMVPVGAIGTQLIFERVRASDLGLFDNSPGSGVSVVDLAGGRARRLTRSGVIAALVQAPERIWVDYDDRVDVIDLAGRPTGSLTDHVRAVSRTNGTVAYVDAPSEECLTASRTVRLRVGSADGPLPSDTAVAVPCVGADLGTSPDGSTIFVTWTLASSKIRAGILACSLPLLTCRDVSPPDLEEQLVFGSVRGVLTLPAA